MNKLTISGPLALDTYCSEIRGRIEVMLQDAVSTVENFDHMKAVNDILEDAEWLSDMFNMYKDNVTALKKCDHVTVEETELGAEIKCYVNNRKFHTIVCAIEVYDEFEIRGGYATN